MTLSPLKDFIKKVFKIFLRNSKHFFFSKFKKAFERARVAMIVHRDLARVVVMRIDCRTVGWKVLSQVGIRVATGWLKRMTININMHSYDWRRAIFSNLWYDFVLNFLSTFFFPFFSCFSPFWFILFVQFFCK